MGRSVVRDRVVRRDGPPVSGATVRVRQLGTTTDVAETLYAARTGGTTLANPLTTSQSGAFEFWLDEPARVDLLVSAAGLDTRTYTVDALPPGDEAGAFVMMRRFRTGMYYAIDGTNLSSLALVDGRMLAARFTCGVRQAWDRIGVNVSGASTGSIRLGIYADDGTGYPGALVLDAGTVLATSTGAKEATIAQTLDPEVYWLVCVAQGGTPTLTAANSAMFGGITTSALTGTAWTSVFSQAGVAGALPANFSTTVTIEAAEQVPKIMMRAA